MEPSKPEADTPSHTSGDDDREWYADLTRYRQHVYEMRHAAFRDFDRAVLTVSGGAVVVSVTFIGSIIPNPRCVPILIAAWIALGISMATTIWSFLASQDAHDAAIAAINEAIRTGEEPVIGGGKTARLNTVSGVLLIVGTALLILFASLNYGR